MQMQAAGLLHLFLIIRDDRVVLSNNVSFTREELESLNNYNRTN